MTSQSRWWGCPSELLTTDVAEHSVPFDRLIEFQDTKILLPNPAVWKYSRGSQFISNFARKHEGWLSDRESWRLLISLLKRANNPFSSKIFLPVYLAFNALIPYPFSLFYYRYALSFYSIQLETSDPPFIHSLFPTPDSPSSFPLGSAYSFLQGTSFFLNFFVALPILIAYSRVALVEINSPVSNE